MSNIKYTMIEQAAEVRSCCPSNDFTPGEPSGSCWGDGHYMCTGCKWFRADFKLHGQDYIDAAHNAQSGLQLSILNPKQLN